MSLTTLQITHLRNIVSSTIRCSSQFNLFFGDNAAGKTSLLEAVYYLSMGKSFRTHQHEHVIHHTENAVTLFGQFDETPVGLQRSRNGSMQIHINAEKVSTAAQISRRFPVQFIGSDSHRVLSDGPKCRRQFLDWGLFHTNPLFYDHWKTFQKILAQRNAALKARASQKELSAWNNEFAEIGETLHALRKNYLADFLPFFEKIIMILLADINISLEYIAGWDQDIALASCLNQNVSRETMVGHSLYGPHRADLSILTNQSPAVDVLSQGQQKLVSYALRLAQGLHLHSITEKAPIYLIDDLPSELDAQKRMCVVEILSQLQAQAFITGIEACDLQDILLLNNNNQLFHVKHGVISPCRNNQEVDVN